MNPLAPFLAKLTDQVHTWILVKQKEHLSRARELTTGECAGLSRYFEKEALMAARVSFVERMENPPFYDQTVAALAALGMPVQFDLRDAAGITFVDCMVLCGDGKDPSLVFHEMVHIVQYQLLGSGKFAEMYVRGLAAADFVYERNPMEAMAYELQGRFERGEVFSVRDELVNRLRALGTAVQ